jgi:hypothetical protein
MKRLRRIALFLMALAAPLTAQQEGLGIGGFLGDAAGVSGKLWFSPRYALAGGVGASLAGGSALHLHADWLLHDDTAPQRIAFLREMGGDGLFVAYYGAGARLLLFDVNRLGIRGVGGLLYAAGRSPWDVYLEIAPTLDIVPDSDWDVAAFLGVRWFLERRAQPATPRF